MTDLLRPLWDFDDLDATERRFAALQAEVLTQLARVQGLRGDFEGGERLLAEAAALADTPAVRARLAVERGRLKRSAGDPAAAFPLFEEAFAIASEAEEEFLAADAAHMAAIATEDLAVAEAWAQRGIDLAESSGDPDVRYWVGPLLNNLGWSRYDAGDYEAALDAFERALAARERDPSRPREIELAREAVDEARRALAGA